MSKLRGITSSVEQDLAELEYCRKQAEGPNHFVIGAMGAQIKSTYRLEETIKSNIRESKRITTAVQQFEKSTNKTEKIMLLLAIAQVFFAIVQLILS